MPSFGAAAAPDLDEFARRGFVEITPAMGVRLDIRYATDNNFLHRDVYGGFDRLYLHPTAAEKLHHAIALLRVRKPGWQFLLFDGLRPNRVQRQMWAAVRGTPEQRYVGDPAVGSIHGYGLAIDLSLSDGEGREIDMGTAFDDFSPASEPRHEAALVASGQLTTAQIGNRRLLRALMTDAGFHMLPLEWWHFDALPPAEVRARFPRVE